MAAGGLLAVYGAGMVVPLLLIAALWQKLGARGRSVLRGRTFTVLGRELHTTSVLTGLLIIAVGIVFWTTNGLVGAPELLPYETQGWLQEMAGSLANPVVDILVLVALAGVALFLWARRQRRTAASRAAQETP